MQANYFKNSLSSVRDNTVATFLSDVILKEGTILDFDESKQYSKGDKVYYADKPGVHYVRVCVVDKSTAGSFVKGEWRQLIDSVGEYALQYIPLELIEEVFTCSVEGETEYAITSARYIPGKSKVRGFHSSFGRMINGVDFNVQNNGVITLTSPLHVGEKIIFDLINTPNIAELPVINETFNIQYTVTSDNQATYTIQDDRYDIDDTKIFIYHSVYGRLFAGIDYTLDTNIITFDSSRFTLQTGESILINAHKLLTKK